MKKMCGYFAAYNKDNNELIGRYKYSTVSDVTKIWLRKNLDKISLKCCCNDNRVEMKISSDLKIYPAKNDTGNLHDDCCPKHPISESLNTWTFVKDESGYYNQASPEANAEDYAKKINKVVDDYLHKKDISINTFQDFNKYVYYHLGFIKTPDGHTLKDRYSASFRNPAKASITDEIFIYGIVRKVQSTEFDKEMLYVDIEDVFGKTSRFYIQKNLFLDFYNSTRISRYRSLACGFAYKKSSKSKIFMISDFYMAPINDLGLLF